MKKLAIAVSAIALIGTPVFAADVAVKATPRAPAPVYSWTGWYAGGNIGYSWGKASTDFSTDPVIINDPIRGLITLPGFAGSDSVKPKGIIGGAQIGYNWQYSPNWVAGVEADIQASGEKAGNTFANSFFFFPPIPLTIVSGTAVTSYEAKIDWFGTLRGRIGYVWDRWMLYATGGLAYGDVKLAGTSTVNGTVIGGAGPFTLVTSIGRSRVNAGWTVGGGIEGPLVNNWTWKAEYLYIDLGTLDDPEVLLPSVSGGTINTHTHFTDNIARIGLNYQFH